MTLLRSAGLALAALAIVGVRAEGADFNMNVIVENISLGKHVMGPELAAEDLKHRVVLLEFWGIN